MDIHGGQGPGREADGGQAGEVDGQDWHFRHPIRCTRRHGHCLRHL